MSERSGFAAHSTNAIARRLLERRTGVLIEQTGEQLDPPLRLAKPVRVEVGRLKETSISERTLGLSVDEAQIGARRGVRPAHPAEEVALEEERLVDEAVAGMLREERVEASDGPGSVVLPGIESGPGECLERPIEGVGPPVLADQYLQFDRVVRDVLRGVVPEEAGSRLGRSKVALVELEERQLELGLGPHRPALDGVFDVGERLAGGGDVPFSQVDATALEEGPVGLGGIGILPDDLPESALRLLRTVVDLELELTELKEGVRMPRVAGMLLYELPIRDAGPV